jgi:hypothetical protein
MQPAIGDIVHFVLPSRRDQHRAAIVVRVVEGGRCNLQLFLDIGESTTPQWKTDVPRDDRTKAPGTWHYPEEDLPE